MGLAAEYKIGSTYINAQYSFPSRTFIINMGHPQPPTKHQIDNTTAEALSKDTFKKKLSKSIDMHFYWLQDYKNQD